VNEESTVVAHLEENAVKKRGEKEKIALAGAVAFTPDPNKGGENRQRVGCGWKLGV